jgi:hypothetical protein
MAEIFQQGGRQGDRDSCWEIGPDKLLDMLKFQSLEVPHELQIFQPAFVRPLEIAYRNELGRECCGIIACWLLLFDPVFFFTF